MILTEAIPTRTLEPAVALSPARLLGVVRGLASDPRPWRSLVRHTPGERWFLRLDAQDEFDTWLIGWDSHQGVDLHDHGGSAGAFYVVEGELLETSTRAGGTDEYDDQRIAAGTARAFGPGHVHRVVNPSAAVATSVHVYSPPLVSMDFYEAAGPGPLQRTHREPALGTRSGRGELR
ncbi:MAG TPA: cysteine dioxygenase family protein [Acidimicrobiia bacterium]|nr:cysteine dioxygenase family protein [Acidimicrobiia bacterium]